MSGLPDISSSSVSTAGYVDGLGRRSVRFNREVGGMLECLHLRPQFLVFEGALRARAEELARLDDERFATVRAFEKDTTGLRVISDLVTGHRLIDVLEARNDDGAVSGIDAAFGFLLQAMPALAQLHANSITHGALAPGRIIITPNSQVVLLDSIYGSALERLNLSRQALWTSLGIMSAPVPGAAPLDRHTDVAQVALCALLLAAGRPLDNTATIDGLRALVPEVAELAEIRAGAIFAAGVGQFFNETLPGAGKRRAIGADDAAVEIRRLLTHISEDDSLNALAELVSYRPAPSPRAEIPVAVVAPAPVAAVRVAAAPPPASTPVVPSPVFTADAPTAPVAPVTIRPAETVPVIVPIAPIAAPPAVPPVVDPPVVAAPWIPEPRVVEPMPVPPPATAWAPTPQPSVSMAPPAPPPDVQPVPVVTVTPQRIPVGPPLDTPAPIAPVMTPPPAPYVLPPVAVAPVMTPPPAPYVLPPVAVAPVMTPPPAAYVLPPMAPVMPPIPVGPIMTRAQVALQARPAVLKIREEKPPGYAPIRLQPGEMAPAPQPTARALPFLDRAANEREGTFPWKIAAAAVLVLVVGGAAGRDYLMGGTEPVVETPAASVPAPVPASTTTGGLVIDSQPTGATVAVDGNEVGTTPLTLDAIKAGRHQVTITSGAAIVQRSVRIEAGKQATISVPVFSGWVAIFAPIRLDVSEGRRSLGSTESGRILLPPGRHVLTLSNAEFGYKGSQTVEIVPGEERVLNLRPTGMVNLNASPWAEVWVDGTRAGETPLANLEVPLGTREFVFKHPQYGERKLTATITTTASALSVDFGRPPSKP